ncbi:potassium channel family protein [Clostridium pasteurianum]|uniref:Ion channel n=1 Tax=Clostridium pasteurianum BC1 TaxID=86416 RepID=R4K9Z7_CLOPA|nr:potassium channel family protein [Clostridium pasteurianum]AGK97364.1 Ion channel [Clostridium pasteurianum BC1]
MYYKDTFNSLIKNSKLKRSYELSMALLSIIIIIMIILEYMNTLSLKETEIMDITDNVITIVFAIDYFTRLILSKNKKEFFKHNIIDLIAIIPFNSIFQVARILKITRLARLTKIFKVFRLLRVFVLLEKFKKNMDDFFKTNNFHYAVWITFTTVIIGAVGMYLAEGRSFTDSLWWSFVTVTTVGYGDISPSTTSGRIIAAILMLVGIGFLGILTGTISTFFIKQEKEELPSLKNETIEMIKSRLNNYENLTNDDLDFICNLIQSLKHE